MYLSSLLQFDVKSSMKIKNHFRVMQFLVTTMFIAVIISTLISPSVGLPLDPETPSADSNAAEEPGNAEIPVEPSVPQEGVAAESPSEVEEDGPIETPSETSEPKEEGDGDGDVETPSETSVPKEEGDGDAETLSETSVPEGEGDGDAETPSETSEPKEGDGDAETPSETSVPKEEGDGDAETLSETSVPEGEGDGDAETPSETSEPKEGDGDTETPSETSVPKEEGDGDAETPSETSVLKEEGDSDAETPSENSVPKQERGGDASEKASDDVPFTNLKSKKDCKNKKERKSKYLVSSPLSNFVSASDNRAANQLSHILIQVYGWRAFKFIQYGNFCGLNVEDSSGWKPIDECDRCCQMHDNCYTKALSIKGCSPYTTLFIYNWTGRNGLTVQCSKNNQACALQTCMCDMEIAECMHQVGVVQNLC